MKTIYREAALGGGFVILALVVIFVVIPAGITMPGRLENRALAPNFWPLIIMGVLGLSGAILLLQALTSKKLENDSADSEGVQDAEKDRPMPQMIFRVGTVFGVLFVFYFAISLAGIVLPSMLAVAFLTWFAGERRWKIIVPLAILLPILLYYFFVHVAQITMPLGVFETA